MFQCATYAAARRGLINFIVDHPLVQRSGIVFTRSKRDAEQLNHELQSQDGITSDVYHSGRAAPDNDGAQRRWMREGGRWMVATTGFGTGVDRHGVALVLFLGLPYDMHSLLQQAGRAARGPGEVGVAAVFAAGASFTSRDEEAQQDEAAVVEDVLLNGDCIVRGLYGYVDAEPPPRCFVSSRRAWCSRCVATADENGMGISGAHVSCDAFSRTAERSFARKQRT